MQERTKSSIQLFNENYNSLEDSELREEIVRHYTTITFESSIANALENYLDFCYETNFDSHPLVCPKKFKENGYVLNLIFFCLINQKIARHRNQVLKIPKGFNMNSPRC